jgi:hypothetical protein
MYLPLLPDHMSFADVQSWSQLQALCRYHRQAPYPPNRHSTLIDLYSFTRVTGSFRKSPHHLLLFYAHRLGPRICSS